MDRKEARELLGGPVPSIRTPFLRDGSVDLEGLRAMVDFLLAAGSRALMLTAGDSHYFCLSEREIAEITTLVCRESAGRAAVIAADLHLDTARAVSFARFCREAGASIYMALPPDWVGSSTPGTLAEHYAAVARELPVMIVTNIFIPRGGEPFALETIGLAAALSPGVVAVKDDICGNFAHRLGLEFGDSLALVAGGQKANHLNMWPYGCTGYLSSFLHFWPDLVRRYWGALEEKRVADACRVIREVEKPLFRHLASYPGGWNAGMHGLLEISGRAGRWRRKPYYTLDDREMERLAAFTRALPTGPAG